MNQPRHYFLSGIGGSGMMPLAIILKGLGHTVSGSDRSHDQGRTPEKFANLEAQGFKLYPQDGSGLCMQQNASPVCAMEEGLRPDFLIVSTAVEDTVPDVQAAKQAGIEIIKRAELLAQLFNGFAHRIAIAGTSGKTTTTGMIGFILKESGLDPVVMNGGVMRNYNATALVGKGDVFVTEADESDGSISLYNPEVAVLNNISLDHKTVDELKDLFTAFLKKSAHAAINLDHETAVGLAKTAKHSLTYSLSNPSARFYTKDIVLKADGTRCTVHDSIAGSDHSLILPIPGRHNIANALAAIAAVNAVGVDVKTACQHLEKFQGICRRMEVVGVANDITVIDDFGHNPDKIAATLSTLRQFPGRLLIMFQMHGFGPLKLMWQDLAASFADGLDSQDIVFMPDPLYLGGTADKTIGTQQVASEIEKRGKQARWFPTRDSILGALTAEAKPGDRIVIMGARDDSLGEFARKVLKSL